MKKTKYLAIATTLGVLSTSFIGCGVIDNPEETAQLAASVSELESYNLDVLCNIKSVQNYEDFQNEYVYAIRTKEKVSGNNVALTSIDADCVNDDDTQSVSFGETYIMTDDALYINMQSIISTYANVIKQLYTTFGEEDSFDVNMSSVSDITWVEIPLIKKEANVEKSVTDISDSLSTLMKNVIEKSDVSTENIENGYTLEIKDRATAINVLETVKGEIESNKDLYITQIDTALNTIKNIDYVGFYENMYLDAVKGFCDYAEVTYTDEDMKEISNRVREAIAETSAELESDIGSIGSAYDEYLDELNEMINGFKDNEDIEVSFSYTNTNSGDKGSQVFEQVFKLNAKNEEDTYEATITYKASETNESVTAPSNAESIQNIISKFINFFVDNHIIDADNFDEIKGKTLKEIMNAKPDYDWNDEPIDWDEDEEFNWDNYLDDTDEDNGTLPDDWNDRGYFQGEQTDASETEGIDISM